MVNGKECGMGKDWEVREMGRATAFTAKHGDAKLLNLGLHQGLWFKILETLNFERL